MKVIFLDVDGVLNCDTTTERINGCLGVDPRLVKNLAKIISATEAEIILSSTWRMGMIGTGTGKEDIFMQELRKALAAEGLTIKGRTRIFHTTRGVEIEDWLKRTEDNIESFVIIDDENDMDEVIDHLVQTDSSFGLQLKDVDKAIDILNSTDRI